MKAADLKTAIVIGATGLIGSNILNELLEDERYGEVKVFHRRATDVEHAKLTEHVIDFESIGDWKHLITGNELYSAMGTTIKQARSKDAQWKVDHDYPLQVAEQAQKNGVGSYALISSLGADENSSNFYLGMKGSLDTAVQKLGFEKVLILRPSFLKGERKDKRPMEKIASVVMEIGTRLPGLGNYKPIEGETVGRAAIQGLNGDSSKTIYEGKDIFALAGPSQF